eukprot:3128920-Karenia_brevis.AAC.1
MEALFDNAKFRKLTEIAKNYDKFSGKVVLDIFQQSTARTVVQKLHNIIAEEGILINAAMNVSVGNKSMRRLPAMIKGTL